MTKRRRIKKIREASEAKGSLDNSENKVDELLEKFVSENLTIFQEKLLETLLEKNNRITELTTANDELEEKTKQQEAAIRKSQTELDDLKRLTVKEMKIISEMYEDKIKLFTEELGKKEEEIKVLKAKSSRQNDHNLVKKLKSKLIKRKEKSRIQLRKIKASNEDLENELKVAKNKLKIAKKELEENESKVEKLEKNVSKVTKENEALKEEVSDLVSLREDNEDKEIKMRMLTEKNNSNENLLNDLSARNKTSMEENSNLKEKIKLIQLEHDSVAHDNFKKQDEIDKLQEQCRNLEDQLNKTEKEKQEAQKTLENTSVVKIEKSRINDVVCEDNENLRNDLRKLIEEKLECDKLIVKLKNTIMNKDEERKKEKVQIIELGKVMGLKNLRNVNGIWVDSIPKSLNVDIVQID